MNSVEKTLSYLKAKKHKITKVRSLIIEIIVSSPTPLSVGELLNMLEKVNLQPNKTTIYRELDFLLKQGIIREVDFGESKKRYEFSSEQHHHHVICIKCKKIEDVDLDQDLSQYEDKIAQEKNFKIINHSLEFFGLCPNCQ